MSSLFDWTKQIDYDSSQYNQPVLACVNTYFGICILYLLHCKYEILKVHLVLNFGNLNLLPFTYPLLNMLIMKKNEHEIN